MSEILARLLPGAGAGLGAGIGAEAPKLVHATPYKALYNLINRSFGAFQIQFRLYYLYYN